MAMLNSLRLYYIQFRLLPKGSFSWLSLIRYFIPWKNSIKPGKNTLSDGKPWMTYDAIRFLNKKIKNDMKVFEYGSGGSSVFFSKLASEIVSVEHDKNWFASVQKNITLRGITNWKGILSVPEDKRTDAVYDTSDPEAYGTSDETNRNFSFEKYVKNIDRYPDGYFDLVVIDGRSRPSCIKHSVSKVKKNGFILLDNADRSNYQDAISKYLTEQWILQLDRFGPTSYNPDFTLTKIWKKS
jgi:hypothetical protein